MGHQSAGEAEHPDESALLDFSAGRLGVTERDELLYHLDICGRCRQLLSRLASDSKTDGSGLAPRPADPPTKLTDPLLGQTLGEYVVLERIGQGGMGVLYRGHQPVIGKAVAIKVLLPEVAEDPNHMHRLLTEARAVNAIRHPGIVNIFSFGQLADGRPYTVMELLDGQPLSQVLAARVRLTPQEAMGVLSQTLAALEAAHEVGVIHRDIKPENIFVTPRARGWQITVLDFGLARRLEPGVSPSTAPNLLMGTPGYMSPEQIRGGDISPKTDIYALGVVGWHLLVGREPFEGATVIDVLEHQVNTPAPPIRPLNEAVPVALEELVLRMMRKNPSERPTAAEVRVALERAEKAPRPIPRKSVAPLTSLDAIVRRGQVPAVATDQHAAATQVATPATPVGPVAYDPSTATTGPLPRVPSSATVEQPAALPGPRESQDFSAGSGGSPTPVATAAWTMLDEPSPGVQPAAGPSTVPELPVHAATQRVSPVAPQRPWLVVGLLLVGLAALAAAAWVLWG